MECTARHVSHVMSCTYVSHGELANVKVKKSRLNYISNLLGNVMVNVVSS